jgi:hypothetical protein
LAKDEQVEIARLQTKYAHLSGRQQAAYQAIISVFLVLAVYLLDHPNLSYVENLLWLLAALFGAVSIMMLVKNSRSTTSDIDYDFNGIPTEVV